VHTYSQPGNYVALLTVIDDEGEQDTDSILIYVNPSVPPPSTSISATPTSGDTPLVVNFTGSVSGGISPYTYNWNFGDGTTSTLQNSSHTYNQPGDYNAILAVTDSTSRESSDSITINVSSSAHEVSTPNTPNGQSSGAPDEIITFQTEGSICSHGHPVEYQFNWGDGTYSTWSSATNASHSWSSPENYSIRVRARCTIDNTIISGWSSVKTVQITTSSSFNLTISAVTGGPAPGFGGVSYPSPGNYTYNKDSEVSLSAIPNNGYRFSKWTGDLNITKTYDEEITISMDQNKDIISNFYTQCGDVNGDLAITPADSQDVFGIFLGTISDPTEAQKENADVNCDGTKTEPKITPADAQAIFDTELL